MARPTRRRARFGSQAESEPADRTHRGASSSLQREVSGPCSTLQTLTTHDAYISPKHDLNTMYFDWLCWTGLVPMSSQVRQWRLGLRSFLRH